MSLVILLLADSIRSLLPGERSTWLIQRHLYNTDSAETHTETVVGNAAGLLSNGGNKVITFILGFFSLSLGLQQYADDWLFLSLTSAASVADINNYYYLTVSTTFCRFGKTQLPGLSSLTYCYIFIILLSRVSIAAVTQQISPLVD